MSTEGPGSYDALRRLAAAALALGRIKLELLALDWQDEKERLAQLLVLAVAGSLLAGFALIALAVTITVALWDTPHRLLALVVTSVVLVAAAAASWWRIVALLRAPSPLATTLRELQRDEATLRGRHDDVAAPPGER